MFQSKPWSIGCLECDSPLEYRLYGLEVDMLLNQRYCQKLNRLDADPVAI